MQNSIIYPIKGSLEKCIELLLIGSFICLTFSCKKLIEVSPPYTQITSENVYEDAETAIAAVTGIYTKLSINGLNSTELNSTSFYTGLSGDELTLSPTVINDQYVKFYQNSLQSIDGITSMWITAYSELYTINAALEGLNEAKLLSPKVKQQLLGEVRFLRALYYFYLINTYGDVPLVLTTNYVKNATLPRENTKNVYQQIVTDLNEAKILLSESYLDKTLLKASSERVRPTKWAAIALLARVYLYMEQWDKAENEATTLIGNNGLFSLESLDRVFLANNREAIWQLQPVNQGWNTEEARIFIIPPTGFSNVYWPVYLSNNLMSKFESNDERKANWVGVYTNVTTNPVGIYHYPYKYKSATLDDPITEYTTIFRLGEQYLIRAEARAHLTNLPGAVEDLNAIRTRAGLGGTNANTTASLLEAILQERAVELFTEWGHRWFDIKRTNTIDNIMQTVAIDKGSTWSPNWALYPVPAREIESNPNLTQNSGY